jgi:hypothetical protein
MGSNYIVARINRGLKFDLVSLIAVVAITRWIFRSHYLYDLDSVNFALGIRHFDPRVHQPHPPGYPLYISMGKLLNFLVHDANTALVLLSVTASCGAAFFVYLLTFEWFDQRTARAAGLLLLLSPLAWFHGIVALTYMVEACFSAVMGYLCWRTYRGEERFAVLASFALAICVGVRPSSLMFLAPLLLFSSRRVRPVIWCLSVAVLLVSFGAWFVPTIVLSGGWHGYFGALNSLWKAVPSKGTIFNSSPLVSVARAVTIVFIYTLMFGAASLVPIRLLIYPVRLDSQKRNFTLAWTLPALCFFTFGYLKFVNSGYLLILLAPGCVWLSWLMTEWFASDRWQRGVKWGVAVFGAATNVFIFLFAPLYCSYREIRRFESRLAEIRTALPQVASPSDTVILAFDSHFNGFRHAGYYLPEYFTVAYPATRVNGQFSIFTMQGENTRLRSSVPGAPFRRFVIFPLPNGADYQDYQAKALAVLPSEGLKSISAKGQAFVVGPISDLPLLFSEPAPKR